MTKCRTHSEAIGRLVLTRKENEAILIGDDVRIVLTKPKDGHAKIVIEAPKNMTILREELNDV